MVLQSTHLILNGFIPGPEKASKGAQSPILGFLIGFSAVYFDFVVAAAIRVKPSQKL